MNTKIIIVSIVLGLIASVHEIMLVREKISLSNNISTVELITRFLVPILLRILIKLHFLFLVG